MRTRLAMAAVATGLLAGPALAAEKSSLPNYPPGLTIGTPAGIISKPGIYVTDKTFFTSVDPVDGNGKETGAHLDSYATVLIVQWVPGWHILGANYAFQADSYGVFHANLRFPAAAHLPDYGTTGTSDLAIRPIALSWKLGPHLWLGVREGVYIPTGSWAKAAPVSISHHRVTFEQGAALSYLDKKWTISANGIFDANGANHDTVIGGKSYSYRSGDSVDVDVTAVRKVGPVQVGPVGYVYHQISEDRGAAILDGGAPTEAALGAYVGHQFGKINGSLYGLRDVYGRNVGIQSRIWLTLSIKAL